MMKRLPVFEILLVLAGVLLLAVLGVLGEHKEARKIDTYSTYDARSGGYRAWYELLEREGVRVQRFERRWAFLDPSIKTLVLAFPLPFDTAPRSITKADRAALAAWVAEGGTMVALGAFTPAPDSPFASVRYVKLSSQTLRMQGVERTAAGEPIVRKGAYRRGTIFLVEDETLMTNAKIGRADDARLAYFLGGSRGGWVAFDETLHGYLIPEHWWMVAPRRLLIALTIAGAVVLIALLGAAVRLGPPIVAPTHREATSSEYVHAVASLYARVGARQKILREALSSARRAGASEAELAEVEALAALASPDDRALVRGVAKAYRLRY